MILDGKKIAAEVYEKLAAEWDAAARANTKLGIIVVGHNPVIESFVGIKARAAAKLCIPMVRVDMPDTANETQILQKVMDFSKEVDALIVQLPLPKTISTDAALSAIPKEKDVDALNPTITEEERPVHAPVALAVVELLGRGDVDIKGKRTVVVGTGRLVGAPSALLLRKHGANVSIFSRDKGSIEDLKTADIVVLGAGNPGFIKPEHLKDGVALIDAGTSELNKKILGDADPACAEVASVFTPVPGGVGPVAVAMLFKNLFDLVQKHT